MDTTISEKGNKASMYLSVEGNNSDIICFLRRNKKYGERWWELFLEHRVDIDAESGLFGANIPVESFDELSSLILQLRLPYVDRPRKLQKPNFRLDLGVQFKNEFLSLNVFLQETLTVEAHYKKEAQNKTQLRAVVDSIKLLENAFFTTGSTYSDTF